VLEVNPEFDHASSTLVYEEPRLFVQPKPNKNRAKWLDSRPTPPAPGSPLVAKQSADAFAASWLHQIVFHS
jgi:hypothetical protein